MQAKQSVKDYAMQSDESNESLGVFRLIFPARVGRRPVIGWKYLGGPWPLSHFYREPSSGCITDCKGSDTTWELRMTHPPATPPTPPPHTHTHTHSIPFLAHPAIKRTLTNQLSKAEKERDRERERERESFKGRGTLQHHGFVPVKDIWIL